MGAEEKPRTSVFTRNATGLVRQIGAFDSFVTNFLSMALFGVLFIMVFAMGLYPNANIPISIAVALIPATIVALTYIVMSVAMPRTGGDYVWVGRIIHPVLGFVVNFGLTFYLFTFIAIDVGIFTQWGIGAYLYNIGITTNNQGALNLATQLNTSGNLTVFGISAALIGTCRVAGCAWHKGCNEDPDNWLGGGYHRCSCIHWTHTFGKECDICLELQFVVRNKRDCSDLECPVTGLQPYDHDLRNHCGFCLYVSQLHRV